MNMTCAQIKQKQNRYAVAFYLALVLAVTLGFTAKHFLIGSGYFAGIEVDESFWGGIALSFGVISAFVSGYACCKMLELGQKIK